ncbi:hypothetical protein D9M71_302260 [compost metagenome]
MQQRRVVIGAPGKRQADRHADVRHHAHRYGDRRHTEMTDGEVAIGDPYAVAPGDIRRLRIDIGIRRTHIGHRREQHRVEAQAIHPVFQIDLAGLFQAAQAVRHRADLIPRRDAAFGHAHVFVHAGGQVTLAVGQGARVMREDLRTVDIDEAIQFGIAVRLQEIIEGPGGQVPQFMV